MLWDCRSIPSVCPRPSSPQTPLKKHQSLHFEKPLCFRTPKPSTLTCPRAQFSEEIAQLAHNKVLIAAGVSAAIGQLSKPFTTVILYGKDFNLKAAIQAGGFPSTHSSAVVATATCLGLERGLSDSIFGLTVVYASLTMYDAQGVRREVGVHAKMLNKVLQTKPKKVNYIPTRDRDVIDSQPGTSSSLNLESFFGPDELSSEEAASFTSKTAKNPLARGSEYELKETSSQMLQIPSPSPCEVAGNVEEERNSTNCSTPLKESIGHTEVEVTAGALLGFLMSGAQGAQPKYSKAATTYESVEGGENRTRTELRSEQDQGGIQVDKLQDKVPDAAGKGGPVFGAGKDDNNNNKQDLGVTGTG